MNLSKAVGKFGTLLVEITTYVKDSLTNVSDDFAEWLGTESGKSALRTAVATAVQSLLNAHEEFKREAAKLFSAVGEINFPGTAEKWLVGGFFTIDNKITKFSYVDTSLFVFLGDREIEGSPARRLAVQKLKRNAGDVEILSQLGENPDLTPAELRWVLEVGSILHYQWYVGYVTHLGVRRAVRFRLGGQG